MTVLKALFLGLIHGFTEFFPLSSSGHMAFFGSILKADSEKVMFLDILLHIATMIAVIVFFRKDILNMFRELGQIFMTVFANLLVFISRRRGDNRYTYFKVINSSYKKLIVMITISTMVTAVLGIFGQELVSMAGSYLWTVGICFIISSVILFLSDRHCDGTLRIKEAQYSGGILMGAAQGIAVLPGITRTGAAISMGIFLGYNNKLAVKYSFIMSIPAVLGSTVYRLIKYRGAGFDRGLIPGYVFAMAAAGLGGYFSLKYMLKVVRRKKYLGFSVYCLLAGIAVIVFSIISSK